MEVEKVQETLTAGKIYISNGGGPCTGYRAGVSDSALPRPGRDRHNTIELTLSIHCFLASLRYSLLETQVALCIGADQLCDMRSQTKNAGECLHVR